MEERLRLEDQRLFVNTRWVMLCDPNAIPVPLQRTADGSTERLEHRHGVEGQVVREDSVVLRQPEGVEVGRLLDAVPAQELACLRGGGIQAVDIHITLAGTLWKRHCDPNGAAPAG